MIITSFIISFIVIAIHLTFQAGEIFQFVSRWGKKHIKGKWQKPVFSCPICMTPWYGIPVYFIGHFTNLQPFHDIRIQVIAFAMVISIGITTVYVNVKQV